MENLNIALIGCGMIGREHIERIQNRIRNAKVVAVCDVFEEGAKKGAEIAGAGTKVYTDFNEAINDPDVNAVVVTTPGQFHKGPVLAAIKAGKPVFSEKPLANTAADGKEIVEAEMAGGKHLVQVGFMRRYDRGYAEMKRIIDSGELGKPLIIKACHRNVSQGPGFKTENGVTNVAIHELDICRWLLGENLNEVAVRFPRATCFAEGTCQDPQLVLMQSDSGVLIDVEVSGNSYYGYEILCELVCEKGTIRLPVAAEPIVRSYLQCGQAIPEDWTNRFVVAYQEELQHWVDYLQGKTDVPGPGAEDGYEACKISDALIKAQTTGQWEKVEA